METSLNTPEPEQKADKKSYQPPKMFIYGDIRELTQNVGNMGAGDGGGGATSKTAT